MSENRKEVKICEIEKYLGELESVFPLSIEKYKLDFKIKDVCERHFEKIVEAVVDLAFSFIKEKKFKMPEEDEQSFDILKNAGVISEELAVKLKQAKGMRNIIAQEYGKIDDELIFHAVTEELIPDIQEFISLIEKSKT